MKQDGWTGARTRGATIAGLVATLAVCLLLAGCGAPTAAPPAATPTPRPTPHPTRTPAPPATPSPRPTTAPSDSPTPPPTLPPTATPTHTPTTTPTATSTHTPTATPTATSTHTATPHPRWTATPTPLPTTVLISQGATTRKTIALTFDCGADRGAAPAILDLLRHQGVPASFGVTGRWAEQNPDMIRRMVAQGEQVIDHTYDHQSFTGLSTHTVPLTARQIADELEAADAVLRHLTGSSSRPYYRPPYGDESPATLAAVAATGFNVDIRWTLDSLGWEGISASAIESRVLGNVAPGSIILMHVGAASQDAAALPRVVSALRARGYRFVTVAGLLGADHSAATTRSLGPSSYRAVDPAAVYYPATTTTAQGPLAGDVVVLDPGHGGDDPGTCYPYGYGCYQATGPDAGPVLQEKEVALDIALYHVLPRLHLLGADVYLTRTTLEQNPSLEQRLQLANYVARVAQARKRGLFVSVHLNGADDPTVDYAQALYAANRPQRLAASLADAFARALRPAPAGGDHGVDTFPGHVLRRNSLPATIVEPAFLTNAYPVVTPISVTQIVTATSGAALRQGLRLTDPVVHVRVSVRSRLKARSLAAGTRHLAVDEAFTGTAPLRQAITLARTDAISAALAGPLPVTQTVPASPIAPTPLALAASQPLTGVNPVTATIPPTLTYVISVTGAVSATAPMTTVQGEGPWLIAAHAATRRVNRDYDTLQPDQVALRYAWNDREEGIARGLLQGIAAFYDARLPSWALRPRAAPVGLTAITPPR